MSRSDSPVTWSRIRRRQASVFLAVVSMSILGVASVHANGNGNNGNGHGGATVTHTKEFFDDQPIDDVNRCNNHRVVGQGTLIVEQKQKASPSSFETFFKISQFGKVHWDLDPNERYQYSFSNEEYTRSSTPHFTTTTETKKQIVRIGRHRHGNRDCDDDHYGKGKRYKADSWFFYEKVTMSSWGASSTKLRDECK